MESLALGRARGRSRHLRRHPGHRPRRDVPVGVRDVACLVHATASSEPQRNSVPSIHMRCKMTASFRATAITARRRPRVLASRTPQALSEHHRLLRVTNACAATYRALRTSVRIPTMPAGDSNRCRPLIPTHAGHPAKVVKRGWGIMGSAGPGRSSSGRCACAATRPGARSGSCCGPADPGSRRRSSGRPGSRASVRRPVGW